MCGISVACEFAAAPSAIDRVRSMHARVAHRGPDGEGWLAIDDGWTATRAESEQALRHAVGGRRLRVTAAFRWLSIQDRHPSSCQPMGSTSGETWVLFNGEIYNHRDLRGELASHGREFRTSSDTEVLLVAYEHWGPRCFEHLNGMWGAVVIDLRRRSITMSRDRFGIRPLFYRLEGGRLLLGSEAKQVASRVDERPALDRSAVFGFLDGRRPTRDQTYFAGVRALPPATFATVSLDAPAPESLSFSTYWRLEPESARFAASPQALAAASTQLERHLEEAIGLQSVATVPVGVLLSGGLDSSVVSSLLVQARRRQGVRSWLISVTAEDVPEAIDERPYSRAVAASLAGADVTSIESPLHPRWVTTWIDRATWHQEEPLPGVALVAQLHAYHVAAAHGVRVVLEGTGSDELFAGYPRHQFARVREYAHRRRWLKSLGEFAAARRRDPVFGEWFREAAIASLRRRWRRVASLGYGARHDVPVEATPALGAPPALGLSMLGRMSYADLTWGNVPAVLAVADRNAMANSVESRVPYLDHRLVEFGFRLPDDFKTARGDRKIVLREVARRRLPALVAERRARVGFGMPLGSWLRDSLRPVLLETIHSPEVTRGDVFQPSRTERFVSDFLSGRHDDVASVWRILALARWLRVYEAGD